MKIIVEGKVYVQLNDIMYIFHNLEETPIPSSIFDVVFKDGKPLICTDENRYEFVEFTDKGAIDFFKDFDYSVDYLTLRDKSEEELIEIGVAISEERNNLAKKFNEMSDEDKQKNQSMVFACKMLVFKMLSVRDIVWMKQEHLKIKLPNIEELKDSKKKPFYKLKNIFKKK